MTAASYLGFDFGEKYIGVAVGSRHTGLAQPLDTVAARPGKPDWDHIGRLIETWRPVALVVGLPLNMDDSDNAITRAARKFGNRLRERYNLPVHMVDERLTSVMAKNQLLEAGIGAKRFKTRVDRLAAQAILQAWLDEHREDGNAGQR